MNNIKNKKQEMSSNPTGGNRSDGMWAFFILTFVLMLLSWGALAIFQMPVANSTNTEAPTSAFAMALYFFGGFTPSIAGIIMAYRQHGRAGLRDMWKRFTQFNLGAKWYLVIIAIPFFIQAGVALIYKLQGGDFVRSNLLDRSIGLVPLLISIFIGGPLSEEFGWRGFAQDRVQARWGSLKGSIVLGLAWAFWHLPLFFAPGTGQQQIGNPALTVPVFTIWVVAMAILYSWIYNNTNRSLWGAVFFHFTSNFGANALLSVAEMTDQFMYTTNAIMWTLLAVIFVFFVRRKKQHDK